MAISPLEVNKILLIFEVRAVFFWNRTITVPTYSIPNFSEAPPNYNYNSP